MNADRVTSETVQSQERSRDEWETVLNHYQSERQRLRALRAEALKYLQGTGTYDEDWEKYLRVSHECESATGRLMAALDAVAKDGYELRLKTKTSAAAEKPRGNWVMVQTEIGGDGHGATVKTVLGADETLARQEYYSCIEAERQQRGYLTIRSRQQRDKIELLSRDSGTGVRFVLVWEVIA